MGVGFDHWVHAWGLPLRVVLRGDEVTRDLVLPGEDTIRGTDIRDGVT